MTSLLPSEVLSRAADLIEPEGCWTQRELARTAENRSVDPPSDKAVCWCAAGALQQIVGGCPPIYYDAIKDLRQVVSVGVSLWNDAPERTQSEVVSALRAASELARREGK